MGMLLFIVVPSPSWPKVVTCPASIVFPTPGNSNCRQSEADPKERQIRYEEFLQKRKEAIGDAFVNFAKELRKRAEKARRSLKSQDPAPRLIRKDKAERIWNLPYPQSVKTAIKEMMRLSGKRSEGFNDNRCAGLGTRSSKRAPRGAR
jgi:hypothetical protein